MHVFSVGFGFCFWKLHPRICTQITFDKIIWTILNEFQVFSTLFSHTFRFLSLLFFLFVSFRCSVKKEKHISGVCVCCKQLLGAEALAVAIAIVCRSLWTFHFVKNVPQRFLCNFRFLFFGAFHICIANNYIWLASFLRPNQHENR